MIRGEGRARGESKIHGKESKARQKKSRSMFCGSQIENNKVRETMSVGDDRHCGVPLKRASQEERERRQPHENPKHLKPEPGKAFVRRDSRYQMMSQVPEKINLEVSGDKRQTLNKYASVQIRKREIKKRQTVKLTVNTGRLDSAGCSCDKSEHKESQSGNRMNNNRTSAGPVERRTEQSSRQRGLDKQQKHSKSIRENLGESQSNISTRRHIEVKNPYERKTASAGCRLLFETEEIPRNSKIPHAKQRGRALAHTAQTAVTIKVHQKFQETEQENVGVEAVHKIEFAADRVVEELGRQHRHRLKYKCGQIKNGTDSHMANCLVRNDGFQMPDTLKTQRKVLRKRIQKQGIKRKYATAVRETAKGADYSRNVLNAAGKVVRAVAQSLCPQKSAIGVATLLALLAALAGSLLLSFMAMLSGVQTAVVSTCYTAGTTEINHCDLLYTNMETDLQKDINDTKTNHPKYDEYRFHIGEIGHSPYELMSYLSAVYGSFTFMQIEGELERLFREQYDLEREEIVEERYRDKPMTNPETGKTIIIQVPYDWHILYTTLTVRPLSDIIADSLMPDGQKDRYDIYMQTYGNRQCYGNPFDFSWLGFVSSPYGYRLNTETGQKDLHWGVDISVDKGTPVKAIQDGRVTAAQDAGDYGLCVIIEDGKGYQSRYAYCDSLLVSVGQEVRQEDVIARAGEPHLHLEVSYNGEYLNPFYFVDNGGSGYKPGGTSETPNIPDYSGEPMGDGSFEAMLDEARKFLGYPYVWGGSNPETSFDCSGYVSWVINHSGVGNVGRQTAQGLYNLCTPVSKENARPGDLIFFTGTYSSALPVTHVGILVDGHTMIHCGDPVSFADINSKYWTEHYYVCGRLNET